MNNSELIATLKVLEAARLYLSNRTCSEEPELFKKLYQFENNENLLSLAFEQEFIDWINQHFELAKSHELLDNSIFFKAMLKLVNDKIQVGKMIIKEMNLISFEVLQAKKEIIQSIIEFDIHSEKNYQRLLYSFEKDKAIFQRQYNQLMNGE